MPTTISNSKLAEDWEKLVIRGPRLNLEQQKILKAINCAPEGLSLLFGKVESLKGLTGIKVAGIGKKSKRELWLLVRYGLLEAGQMMQAAEVEGWEKILDRQHQEDERDMRALGTLDGRRPAIEPPE